MKTKVVFLEHSGEDQAFFGELASKMDSLHPDRFIIEYFDCYQLDEDAQLMTKCLEALKSCSLMVLDSHGGLTYFRGFRSLFEQSVSKVRMFIRSGIEDEIPPLMDRLGISRAQYDMMDAYIQAGGMNNYTQLLLYVANQFDGADFEPVHPKKEKWQCLYTPEGAVSDEATYLHSLELSAKPRIGVIIHEHHMRRGDMHLADALHDAILQYGGHPVVLVTNILPPGEGDGLGFEEALERYFMKGGHPFVKAIINTTGMSVSILSSPGDGSAVRETSVFEPTHVPVLQAMQTYYTTAQWEDSLSGLDPMMLSVCAYQPEFDGQIITYPVSAREMVETPYGMKSIHAPIPERVERLAQLAINWARLGEKAPEERKVAIILHNMPPRNDAIGCAFGLDTPASVHLMVQALARDGLKIETTYAEGADIIRQITEGLSNDERWLSAQEMLSRSEDTVSTSQYQTWFKELSPKVCAQLIKNWGEPPGDLLSVDGQLLIPGLVNGNLFIGLQPPRALDAQAEACYHSTDIVCPHQYIAFYHWVERVFAADLIIHVGTHGTLEWLPGKEIGLSKDCYPDITIGTMPHLYIYNVAVTGEGMQAKRRGYAALIGHMVPPMQQSGVYDELAQMDELIETYYHARQGNPSRMPIIRQQVWQLAQQLNLHKDLGITEPPSDMDDFVEKVHLWISRIKSSQVRDGLHILGQPPEGEQLTGMLNLLTRVQQGGVPSLKEAICHAHGLDYHDLVDHGGEILKDGITKAMRLHQVEAECQTLLERLADVDYDLEKVSGWKKHSDVMSCLSFICNQLVPGLRQMPNEMTNFILGAHAGFVSPGPSGNPSRGKAHILPTGRNFYSTDPAAIPTRSAWLVGKTLADQLLKRELEETGAFPESVAIVVYAGDTMKTCGDDLAEAMYLMGVQPVWLGDTDRVIGLDVISLEELGRPRIDVMLRISGLFRDTFPNLIERVEDAVNLVAALDESHQHNYLRKHIDEEIAQMMREGMAREQAVERAAARIFGCPPGGYGAGVDTLIASKKWQTNQDLGNIYIRWSGHAYGRKLRGASFHDQLRIRLQKTSVTVKNESSVEIDMLDSDDFYNYHGGLMAAVRTASGASPRAYSTNTGDTQHISTLRVEEETARVMRSRILNPKWLKGLMRHGYKGAQELSAMVDIVFGWDATGTVVEDWMYESIAQRFVLDQDVQTWIRQQNPWALHAMSERLLEAAQRGMWQAEDDTLMQLRDVFMDIEGDLEETSR